jgi:lipoate-protein ligase B
LNLGLVPYQAAWDLQKYLVDQKKTDPLASDFLILLEHPPVLTLGRWAKLGNVLVDHHRLQELQIDIIRCERGGQVTYHGPGQLIGYPVLNLKSLGLGIRDYVFLLEEVIISALADYDLHAGRKAGYPGVWVKGKKIASLGLAVQGGIAFHGFALNYGLDLDPFQWIVPCGLSGIRMTSLELLKGGTIEAKGLRRRLAGHFEKIFMIRLVSREPKDGNLKKWLENCCKIPMRGFSGQSGRTRHKSKNAVFRHSGEGRNLVLSTTSGNRPLPG